VTRQAGSLTVVLARHGETAWNRADRIQGWAPVGLTDRGRAQARTLGAALAARYDVDRLVASDLRRARETAALLREAGVEPAPTFSRAWRERDVGVLQGLTREELFERHPEYGANSGVMGARATPEGGESMLDLYQRVLGGWECLVEGLEGDGIVLVVTHGGPIYVLLGHLRGMALPRSFLEHSQDNCAITELRVSGGSGPDAVYVVDENERIGGPDGGDE
jgi:probable phosphoglycerate mutase